MSKTFQNITGWCSIIFLVAFSCICRVQAQSDTAYFSADSLKSTVSILADDKLKGRENFTPQLEEAASFISSKFKKLSLHTLNNTESYLYPFTATSGNKAREIVTVKGKTLKPRSYFFKTSYAIVPELSTEDFVKVALDSVPTANILKVLNQYIDSIQKPVLFQLGASQADQLAFINKNSATLHNPRHTILIILNQDIAGADVQVTLKPRRKEPLLYNVIGVLPGKSLASEIVIISAHYDHVGIDRKDGDGILNGANDNASGTAAMLSIAKYYTTNKSNERTIVFVAFAGEELGLLGSIAMSNNFNCTNVKAMFNLEMLGKPGREGKGALIITEDEDSDLKKIMKKYCTSIKIADDRNTEEKLYTRSDNYPFTLKKVPAHTFMCFSDLDPTYHKSTDEVNTLDFENMSLLVKGLLPGIEAIVSGTETPKN